jgi:hypothetical protein
MGDTIALRKTDRSTGEVLAVEHLAGQFVGRYDSRGGRLSGVVTSRLAAI